MEEIGTFIVNNGLGVASFIILVYFMKEYLSKLNDSVIQINRTNEEIAETLVSVKNSLTDLQYRVDKIEKKTKTKKKEEDI